MKKLLLFLFIVIVKNSNAQTAVCDSLVSPCVNGYSASGFYFDLQAGSGNILVTSISTITQNPGTYEVFIYSKQGTFVGSETNPSAWNTVGSAADFTPTSAISCPIPMTEIPIPINVCIGAGQRYGFYVVKTSSGSAMFEVNRKIPTGNVAVSNPSLILFSGKTSDPYSTFSLTNSKDSSFLQGKIKYQCGCSPVSAEENNLSSDINIYPIPAENEINLTVNLSATENAVMIIYDVNGREVLHETKNLTLGFNHLTADINKLPVGIYALRMSVRSKIFYKGSFVKI